MQSSSTLPPHESGHPMCLQSAPVACIVSSVLSNMIGVRPIVFIFFCPVFNLLLFMTLFQESVETVSTRIRVCSNV